MKMDSDTLGKLLDIGKKLSAKRSLDPLLQYVVRNAIDFIGARCGYLVWLQADGSLRFEVRLDQNGDEIDCPDAKTSQMIFEETIQKNKSFTVSNASGGSDDQETGGGRENQMYSSLCVPLISTSGIFGAIYVEKQSEQALFDEEDLHLMEFLASQATIAIENAVIIDDLESRAAARMTELELANQQLEQSWKEAVEIDRVRSDFFAMVAHDIRSPLATILFALELLREDATKQLSEIQKDWLDTSIRMTSYVDQLTRDFLDLLSAQFGELSVSPELINIEEFLLNQYQINLSMPWTEDVQFKLDLESPLPSLYCDRVRIQQVITNLISNAHKCTQHGSVTLYARYLTKENSILIGVQDTGVGIAEEEQGKIFERFWQIGAPGKKKDGLGLGLAICKELIDRHNGRIWVESSPGDGSDFKFTLPLSA